MSSPHPTMETIVANGRIGPYPIPKGTTDKLASVEFGSKEFQYMLATYCDDAQRQLLYLCKAALPILEHVDPEFQRAVWEDSREIDSEIDWEHRALKAQEIMIRLQKELGAKLSAPSPA